MDIPYISRIHIYYVYFLDLSGMHPGVASSQISRIKIGKHMNILETPCRWRRNRLIFSHGEHIHNALGDWMYCIWFTYIWVMFKWYPMVNQHFDVEKMAIEIVDLPIKDGDFPVRKLLLYQRVNVRPRDGRPGSFCWGTWEKHMTGTLW